MTKLDELFSVIENETGVRKDEICGKSRRGEVGRARYFFYHMAVHSLGWREDQLVAILNRNRTMCYHYRQNHENFMRTDKGYALIYNRIKIGVEFESSETRTALTTEERKRAQVFNKNVLIGMDTGDMVCV